jgi:hypothetical protein
MIVTAALRAAAPAATELTSYRHPLFRAVGLDPKCSINRV